ncbi:MAG: hypothetical protein WCS94_20115 [Verrucomicrobiota bacterium]
MFYVEALAQAHRYLFDRNALNSKPVVKLMPQRVRADESSAKIYLVWAMHEVFAAHKHHIRGHPMLYLAMLPSLGQLTQQRFAFHHIRFRLARVRSRFHTY